MAGYWYKYPNYSYRYRLTVKIEVDGKIHSGSSVIEVTWHGGPEIGDVGRYTPTLKGQAALVDLGDKGVIVAALVNGEGYGRPAQVFGPWGTLWLVPRAFGLGTSVDELKDWSPPLDKRRLEADNMPLLLWFPDPKDPTSGQTIAPSEISRSLGPSARLVGAFVEITRDPIALDIGEKLPWVAKLSRKFPQPSQIYLPTSSRSPEICLLEPHRDE